MMAVLLLMQPSNTIIICALIAHAAVLGCGIGTISTLNWEALSRGASSKLRGKALGLGLGFGPGFAVTGSLGAQLLLDGTLFGWHLPPGMEVSSTLIITLPCLA